MLKDLIRPFDIMTDTSSSIAIYHVTISECGEFLLAEAALTGFDYSADSTFLFICQEYKVVVSGIKTLENNPASLYWEDNVLQFPILNIYYYEDFNEFQAENVPRYATRAISSENLYEEML